MRKKFSSRPRVLFPSHASSLNGGRLRTRHHVRLITYHKSFSASPRLPISASAKS
ncbi:MAG: hypothetical protein KME21_03195 [Desmonostoc vinosum HA7617-LM4]|nr:hypothetical protein [Desmonostoc vinosum HA7617-LM4]